MKRSLLREVNERIREVNGTFGIPADQVDVFCECGRATNCLERVKVPVGVYQDLRAEDGLFLVKPGHESRREHVVVEGDTYRVVALQPDPVAARRTQPLRVAPATFRPEPS